MGKQQPCLRKGGLMEVLWLVRASLPHQVESHQTLSYLMWCLLISGEYYVYPMCNINCAGHSKQYKDISFFCGLFRKRKPLCNLSWGYQSIEILFCLSELKIKSVLGFIAFSLPSSTSSSPVHCSHTPLKHLVISVFV